MSLAPVHVRVSLETEFGSLSSALHDPGLGMLASSVEDSFKMVEASAGVAGEGSFIARFAQAAIARTGKPRWPGSRFGTIPSLASVSSVELYCTPIW